MSPVRRTWLAFAAIGAGMVHLALVVSSPVPIAVALVLLGLAEFAWGVITFARDDLLAAGIARIVALAPLIAWSLLVVAATLFSAPEIIESLTLLPMAVATVFELIAAAMLSTHLRSSANSTDTSHTAAATVDQAADAAAARVTPHAGRYLLGVFAGGLVLASLVTPALAATEAGRFAQPHGDHTAGFVPAPADDDPLAGLIVPEHSEGH